MTTIADGVAAICVELSPVHLQALAAVCRKHNSFTGGTKASVSAAVPAPHRIFVRPLIDAWSTDPTLPGVAVALAIDAIGAANRLADNPTVNVVCTGPDSPQAPVRLTSQVVLQLIASATTRITISSFSSYKITAVMAALEAAITRGVQVDLILESQSNLKSGGAETFKGHRVFVWPHEMRPPNANMHAKGVIIDSRDVLLTSANLSNAAFDRNLELGALIRGGTVARSIQQHFDALIANGTLRPLAQ